MSNENRSNQCFGLLLIAAPIIALLFGSNEPAMQTDNAAIIMTGMIFFGIVLLASGSKKSSQPVSMTQTYQMPVTQTVSTPSSFCPHCGAPITLNDAQYCASCGSALHSSTSIQQHGFSGH